MGPRQSRQRPPVEVDALREGAAVDDRVRASVMPSLVQMTSDTHASQDFPARVVMTTSVPTDTSDDSIRAPHEPSLSLAGVAAMVGAEAALAMF